MAARTVGNLLRQAAPHRVVVVALLLLAALLFVEDARGATWTTIGHDAADTRAQPDEHDITPANVAQLAPKWVATTTGDVSATPAVAGGAVYFGDFGGTLWKLDAATGQVVWSQKVA
jgi:polyvinyl alcohol dehydrogenase (cytochrome)